MNHGPVVILAGRILFLRLLGRACAKKFLGRACAKEFLTRYIGGAIVDVLILFRDVVKT